VPPRRLDPHGGATSLNMASARRLGRRTGIVLDIAIVVVLVSHLVAFVVLRNTQIRHDGEARGIAAWMHDQGHERLAWPEQLRAAVPALLDNGVTPVLVDPDVAPQQLAVNQTRVAVTQGDSDLAGITRGQFRTGSLTARMVDLEAAAATPLRPGQYVSQNIARPYIFSPVRDSRLITPDEPFTMTLTLAPGRYVLSVEVFDPELAASLRVSATANRQTLAAATMMLDPVVKEPAELPFAVSGRAALAVNVRVAVANAPNSTTTAFMHEWSVTRTDRTP
jgi:hypothetical protein